MSQTNSPSQLWLISAIESFSEAINTQSQYADDAGITWDRFGSIAAYVFSSYGIATFLVAVLLNRTMLLASATNPGGRAAIGNDGLVTILRRNPRSQTAVLSILRLLLLYVLLLRISDIFTALSVVAANQPGAVCYLTKLVSPYFQYVPEHFANNKFMAMPRDEVRFGPTSAMLWPVFTGVSYSLFVESFSSAILNTKPFLEGGVSLFELSLAIQEMSSGFFFLRDHAISKRPSEQVLILCLFLLCDQAANQIGSFLFQNKYRLIPLTILNVLFIWYYLSSSFLGNQFSFPFSISVTYLSLICVIWISFACLGILALAIVTKGFDLAELNFTNYFADGHRERDFFSQHLGIRLNQDFHVAVLNLGIFAVTLAGKSSYITEYSYVPLPRRTWLEVSMSSKLKAIWQALGNEDPELLQVEHIQDLLGPTQKGYAKIITKPTSKALKGLNLFKDVKPESISKIRAKYLVEIIFRLLQLSICYMYTLWLDFKRVIGYKTSGVAGPPKFLLHDINVHHAIATASKSSLESPTPKPYVVYEDMEGYDESTDYDYICEDGMVIDASNAGGDFEGESDTEVESDTEFEDDNLTLDVTKQSRLPHESVFSELVSADGFIELLENRELISLHWNYLKEHEGAMTRSRYRRFAPQQLTSGSNEDSQKLLDLILDMREDARRERKAESKRVIDEDEDDDEIQSETVSRLTCVICHYNPREIITWPCKCFAICETCRQSLVTKNMEGCVTCRREVEGVSRIYLP